MFIYLLYFSSLSVKSNFSHNGVSFIMFYFFIYYIDEVKNKTYNMPIWLSYNYT